MKKYIIVFMLSIFTSSLVFAQQKVRIATYNIKWLSSKTLKCGSVKVYDVRTQGKRLDRLKKVVSQLDADIIGLQEIRDRKALELIFGTSDWTIVIDDESADCQNLAMAVRKPFTVQGAVNNQLNAGPEHFLFEDKDDILFPGARDVLCVTVIFPGNTDSLQIMVHHAKSRYGGRNKTNPRRIAAAKEIINELEHHFDEKDYVLLGDFNDNPDDASLNILETGNPAATTEMEDETGSFLVNLAEPLNKNGHVSHGRDANDIKNGSINTIDTESRSRNWDNRNNNSHTGDILFDQILVPHSVYADYIRGSAKVFNKPVAIEGESYKVASDHLPLYADFIFAPTAESGVSIEIHALLPNPAGKDQGNERIILKNNSNKTVNISGWLLKDKANHTYPLQGSIAANETVEITMTSNSMPLNNSGDIVYLYNPSSIEVHRVSYVKKDVKEGKYIYFTD